MNKRIIYPNQIEGGGMISIITPVADCGLTLEQIVAKDVPYGLPYKIVDVSDIPTDREFRNAWEADFTDAPINDHDDPNFVIPADVESV